MIRYQLIANPNIYIEAFEVLEISASFYHRENEIDTDSQIIAIKSAHAPSARFPLCSVKIEGEDETGILMTALEVSDIQVGDHVRYDITKDAYVLFDEKLFADDSKYRKLHTPILRRRVTTIIHAR